MKDLFGNEVVETRGEVETCLGQMDSDTLEARANNLAFILSIAPDAAVMMMPQETLLVFTEARDAFVNGLYVGTIMLAQAFIEHRLQVLMVDIGEENAAKRGVDAIIKRLRALRPQHSFIIDKIDWMRSFRNPFTHLKPFEHPHTIGQISLRLRKHPNDILYHNAKEAVALMYKVAEMDWT